MIKQVSVGCTEDDVREEDQNYVWTWRGEYQGFWFSCDMVIRALYGIQVPKNMCYESVPDRNRY
jgi:hypothetical protein